MTTKTSKSVPSGQIQLKWVRSMICTPVKHRKVVKGLGFTRLNQVIMARHGRDSRHGQEDPASGGDSGGLVETRLAASETRDGYEFIDNTGT